MNNFRYRHGIAVRLITRIRDTDGSMRRYGRATLQHVANVADAHKVCEALRSTTDDNIQRDAEVCVTIYTHFMGALTLPLNELREIGEDILKTDAELREQERKEFKPKAV